MKYARHCAQQYNIYLVTIPCVHQHHGIQNEGNSVLIGKQSKVAFFVVLLLVDRPRNHVTGLMAIEPQ